MTVPVPEPTIHKSPLSPLQEKAFEGMRASPSMPLRVDKLDVFFRATHSVERSKWHYLLHTYIFMLVGMLCVHLCALQLDAHRGSFLWQSREEAVAALIMQKWREWLFPLMQLQNEKQKLMDRKSENALIKCVLSSVFVRTFPFFLYGVELA